MTERYQWDEKKRLPNLKKHGFDFGDADMVLDNPLRMDIAVERKGERRIQAFAYVAEVLSVLMVVFAERDSPRIISFRTASRRYTMSGSKITTMTLEEMRAARARGESKTDWARVRAAILRGDEPAEDEDSPDASAEMRAYLEKLKRSRKHGQPPVSGKPKIAIAFRCDPHILAAFRACGPDWQTRMNAALADWLKRHTPAELTI